MTTSFGEPLPGRGAFGEATVAGLLGFAPDTSAVQRAIH